MYILGIETSCDETSAAVVVNGRVVLSNTIASQIDLHAKTGGVVPEVAARQHVEQINAVIAEALAEAGIGFADLGAVAVANRPGLLGALLVGVSAAKALAYAQGIPLIAVHHIEAHIYANWLDTPSASHRPVGPVPPGLGAEGAETLRQGDRSAVSNLRSDEPPNPSARASSTLPFREGPGVGSDEPPSPSARASSSLPFREGPGVGSDEPPNPSARASSSLPFREGPGVGSEEQWSSREGPGVSAIPVPPGLGAEGAEALRQGDRSVPIDFPAICLVVSGGHTEIFLLRGHGDYEILGRTRDDAAGEAFDKSARLLGFPYPGGVTIDKLARRGGNPSAVPLPRAWLGPDSLDFSFSGLKTAVAQALRDPVNAGMSEADWAASVQEAIVDVLVGKTLRAAERHNVRRILMAGGVAANSRLQERMRQACVEAGLSFSSPPPILCTDNAAMIACAGYYHWAAGKIDGLDIDTLSTERLA